MRLETAGASTISSPCRKLCRLERDICIACKRTSTEIAGWPTMNTQQKAFVLHRIRQLPG